MIIKTGIALTAFIMMISCEKDAAQKKSIEHLLTQERWILYAAGFDDNKNGRIDSNENMLTTCQQDNEYRFHINGSGKITEGIHLCDPAINTDFSWYFTENQNELKIADLVHSIHTLNETDLRLIAKIPWLSSGVMTEYKH